ncbi:hypothetical protein SSAG_05819 [Streptomyces sp. Mg1]|nr:hypothetical protein SSAG_05819 [Streptomyces sp. Mg1]
MPSRPRPRGCGRHRFARASKGPHPAIKRAARAASPPPPTPNLRTTTPRAESGESMCI